ncbi:DinB family protein [Planctomycetota bacterium]|nr:DinB family protein [Planctomycetota bacterium]
MIKESLLMKLETSRTFFKNVMVCFTEEDSMFAPKDELYTHVALTVDWFMGPLATEDGFSMEFEDHVLQSKAVTSFSTAMQMLDKSYDDAASLIGSKDEAFLMTPLPDGPIMGGAPKLAVVDGIADHTAHHRGSLAVYARMAGKVPPMPYGDM